MRLAKARANKARAKAKGSKDGQDKDKNKDKNKDLVECWNCGKLGDYTKDSWSKKNTKGGSKGMHKPKNADAHNLDSKLCCMVTKVKMFHKGSNVAKKIYAWLHSCVQRKQRVHHLHETERKQN